MTALTKITKTQVKKLINENYKVTVKILPNKANPNSPWFGGQGVEVYSIEELEKLINGTQYYQCCSELGYGVAFWVEENPTMSLPLENAIPVWKVTSNSGDVFYCMIKDFANYINTGKKKIVEGYVCTPTLTWTSEQLAQGIENNFYFMDDKYEEQKFIKMSHVK